MTRTRYYVLASLFAALTAAGAFIKIPTPIVPVTLQTLFVILAGSLLGPVYGSMSQIIYLAIGLAGVPVFAHGGGPAYILQPTFGYLISYPLAAYAIGYLIHGGGREVSLKKLSQGKVLLANSIGTLIIFAFGLVGLYLNLNYLVGTPTSFNHVLWVGFIIFIPASLIKIAVSSVLCKKM